MALQFMEGTLIFPLTTGWTPGGSNASDFKVFSTAVREAHVVMRGYDVGYVGNAHLSHHALHPYAVTWRARSPSSTATISIVSP
jgi:hypothetical protein